MKKNLQIKSTAELRALLLASPSRVTDDIDEVADGTHLYVGRQEALGQVRHARIVLAAAFFADNAAFTDGMTGSQALTRHLLASSSQANFQEIHAKFALYDQFEDILQTDDCGCTVVRADGYEADLGWCRCQIRPLRRREVSTVADFISGFGPRERNAFPWEFTSENLRPLREGIRCASEEFAPLIACDSNGRCIAFCAVVRDKKFSRHGDIVMGVQKQYEDSPLREEILRIVLDHIEKARFPRLVAYLSDLEESAIAAYKALRFSVVGEVNGARCDGLGDLESMLILARDVERVH